MFDEGEIRNMRTSSERAEKRAEGFPEELLLLVLEFRSGQLLSRAACVSHEGERRLCDTVLGHKGFERVPENGVSQFILDPDAVRAIAGTASPGMRPFFKSWEASGIDGINCTLLFRNCPEPKRKGDYNAFKSSIVFELFNDGALRASDIFARQLLCDCISGLPLRKFTASGHSLDESGQNPLFQMISSEGSEDGGVLSAAAIDRLPSLLSHRADQLLRDGNQITAGAFVRDGVHIGKGNTLLSYVFIDTGTWVGSGNFIDSHVSIGSCAQMGNGNHFGAFASLEGVLSTGEIRVASVGDNNYIGAYTQIGAGIDVGSNNYIGPRVHLYRPTKVKDCRARSLTKGDYLSAETIGLFFNNITIVRNSAQRLFNGVDVLPGEYVLFENVPDCMSRFEGDGTSKSAH